MRHRLIMVSGSGPGAGKSALSMALAHRLARRGQPCRLMTEDELLRMDEFARFDRELGANDPSAIEALLDAARDLAAVGASSEATWITDALLPGFFWLLGRYPLARVDAFIRDLAQVLAPLQPLLVYLDADSSTALGRAGAARGAHWPAEMAEAVARWSLPHYPAPPPDPDGMIRFFGWLNEQTLELLARWPVPTRVLEATRTPVERLVSDLLPDIGLATPAIPEAARRGPW